MYLNTLYIINIIIIVIIVDCQEQKQRINNKFLNTEQCTKSCSNAINREETNDITFKDAIKLTSDNNNNNIDDMVLIESGTFEMGSNDALFKGDEEGPIRNITLDAFLLDKYTVSNEQFQQFIDESNYKTEAERFGNSFVFDRLLPDNEKDLYPDIRAVQAKWWIKLDGACWKHPQGPNSNIHDKMNHPVVHVSWNDANAYCKFYNKRLPSEAEWEKGCRGGLRQKLYPWGNNFMAKNIHRANIWHGDFPLTNTNDDGYFGTCPVNEFPPNNYQLYNMVGNVWEWTSTAAFKHSQTDRIKKGGSFMCHKSYCYRYRCAARSHNTDDSTASNLGFRCAKSIT